MTTLRGELRNEAKRLYIDANYTSRGHYKDAASQARLGFMLGLPVAIVGGITAAVAGVTAIFTEAHVLAGVLALISAVLTSVHGFMQPEKKAEAHGVKAGRYKAVRDDAMFFLKVDLLTDAPDDELRRRLKELRQTYKDLALIEPHLVSQDAYRAAQREIAEGEAGYVNDPLWKDLESNGHDSAGGVS